MSNRLGLNFLRNVAGEAEGLGDAGIETFRGNPYVSVARETAQNSRDARNNENVPIVLKINRFSIESRSFPAIEAFKKAAKQCLQKANERGTEKEKEFFQQAFSVLNKDEIEILSIEDFNTKGVVGPCEEGSPFHALVKADGVSIKENVDSGGSFGIGKSAMFACSDIQTVFFSTRYQDDQGIKNLFMGKTLFMSHKGEDGCEYGRKGYLSLEDYMPVGDQESIPQHFQRNELGTSIFSICARTTQHEWYYEILAALIINFFAAIHRGEMEFEIDHNNIKLNKHNIMSWFNDEKLQEVVKGLQMQEKFDVSKKLFHCLNDQIVKSEVIEIPSLGGVKVHVLLREKVGYTVGIIRNGMYITNNLSSFNEPFKRFPLYREFIALVEPIDKEASEWFKRLENPSHDNLSADRITDPNKRKLGQKLFKELASLIRNVIKNFAKTEIKDSLELNELNDFFRTDGSEKTSTVGPIKKIGHNGPTPIKKIRNLSKRSLSRLESDDDHLSSSDELETPKVQKTQEDQLSPNSTNSTNSLISNSKVKPIKSQSIFLEKERNLLPEISNKKMRRLLFNSPINGIVNIRILAVGLSAAEHLYVASSDEGNVIKGDVQINCKKGKRICLDLEFVAEYEGPLEVEATYLMNATEESV